MKKLISMSLTLSLALSQLGVFTTYAEAPKELYKKTIGNANYTLFEDKKLVIDYTDSFTWVGLENMSFGASYSYDNGSITSVEFGENVKKIPDNMLEDCKNITQITFKGSIEEIGKKAFDNTGISSIVLPDSVKKVQKDAFLNCKDLKSITVNSGNAAIEDHAFGYYYEGEEYKKYDNVSISGQQNSTSESYAQNNSLAFTVLTAPTAVFSDITYETNDGVFTEAPAVKYEEGKVFVLPVPTKENYKFTGWIKDGTKITQLETTQTGAVTLTATWERVYKINYELNGGTNYADAPTDYTENSSEILLGTPSKTGYSFVGWYEKDGETLKSEKITSLNPTIKRDITLAAVWEKDFKITYVLGDETAVNFENAPEYFSKNSEDILLGVPSKSGKSFDGWYTEPEFTNKIEKIVKGTANDITLYAKWSDTFKISYELYGGENYQNAPTEYTYGDTITLQAPSKSGYSFLGWYTDDEFNTPISKITSTTSGDITLYATWARRSSMQSLGGAKYYVRFNSNGGTSVDTQTIQRNHTAERPKSPSRDGYSFAGWYSDSALTEKFDFDTKITKHIMLYARWIKYDDKDDAIYDSSFEKVIILTIGSKTAKVNGKTVQNDVAPMIKNDKTMMPVRFIAEQIGATVKWNEKFRIVTITMGTKQMVIHIDSDIAYINGEAFDLESPAFISGNRTFIPVRFVIEGLECAVDWSDNYKKVTITK